MNQIDITESKLRKGAVVLFIASTIIIGAGFILEIINLKDYTSSLLINNLVAISFVLVGSVLYAINRKNLRLSFFLIVYTALGNIIFGTFANEFTELRLNFFLRDSLFVMLFLTLAALLIHKRHALIIAAIYLVSAVVITFISDNFFMKSSLLLIFVAVGAYALMIRYFVGILMSAIRELEENSILINNQTNQLESKNDELVELNKTKDKFISILAHDLRNPFNTLLGFSEILMTKYDKLSDEKKKGYLHSIQVTTEKTYDLLNKLLDWARSQSGTIAYHPEEVPLDKYIQENLELLAESAQKKGISLKKNIGNDCIIIADVNMVNTIIRNLLSNSIKFTPQHGTITASCFKNTESIILEVKDTGVGIEKQDLDNLFIIDKTISRNGTAEESGSGLGLLLCKDFAEKCGGKISVKSEFGMGSTFSVSFPIVD